MDKAFKHLKNISMPPRAAKQSSGFLECVTNNFLKQQDTRSGTQIDMLFTVKEELVEDVVITSSFGCSHRELQDSEVSERGEYQRIDAGL